MVPCDVMSIYETLIIVGIEAHSPSCTSTALSSTTLNATTCPLRFLPRFYICNPSVATSITATSNVTFVIAGFPTNQLYIVVYVWIIPLSAVVAAARLTKRVAVSSRIAVFTTQ